MSDIVKVAFIAGAFSVIPSILGWINNLHLRRLSATTEKLAEHTNGMQKTIEKLAFKAGEDKERGREKL